jgi:hypothetical protein
VAKQPLQHNRCPDVLNANRKPKRAARERPFQSPPDIKPSASIRTNGLSERMDLIKMWCASTAPETPHQSVSRPRSADGAATPLSLGEPEPDNQYCDFCSGERGRNRTFNLLIKRHGTARHSLSWKPHSNNNLQESCAHRGSVGTA